MAFLAALKSVLNVEVMGLFVEVSDEYGGNKGGVVLGGGVVIARTGVKEKYCMPGGTLHTSKDFTRPLSFKPKIDSITAQDRLLAAARDRGEEEAGIVYCHLDELVGLSCTLKLPIMASSALSRGLVRTGV